MKYKCIFRDDEAVSISIGFILMFAVTVIVFLALIISFYSLSRETETSAMKESFRIIGNGLAIELTAVDAIANVTSSYGGTLNSLDYEISIPSSVAGKSYTTNITSGRIVMEADNGAKITVPFNIYMDLTARKIYSGAENYRVLYNRTANSIEIIEKNY